MSHFLISAISACALGFGLATPGAVQAQDGGALDPESYLAYLAALERANTGPRGQAATVGIPSGFAMPQASGFAALAGSNRRERVGSAGEELDGSGALGFGFGNAATGIGMDVVIGINSVDPNDFGDSGTVGLKFSRQLPTTGRATAIAVGVGNVLAWGDAEGSESNLYLAGTTTFAAGNRAGLLSAGYSTAIGTTEEDDGVFLGAGVSVTDWFSVGASWSGDEALVGANLFTKLSPKLDLQVGLSYGDVGHQNSDGRVQLSVALFTPDLF